MRSCWLPVPSIRRSISLSRKELVNNAGTQSRPQGIKAQGSGQDHIQAAGLSHPQQAAPDGRVRMPADLGVHQHRRLLHDAGIINDFIWSGCTDFAGLGRAILVLVGIYLIGCAATYGQSAVMVRLAQRGSTGCARTCSTNCRTCRFPTLISTPTAS